jgi:hypothetical protein
MGLSVMRPIRTEYGIILSRTFATTLRLTLAPIQLRQKMLHFKAINQNYLTTLERIQNSAFLELQPPLPEDPTIWIFRRKAIS